MLIRPLNKKLAIIDATNQEKLNIRRSCVNVTTSGNNLILEDNLFNRKFLDYHPEDLYFQYPLKVYTDDDINPKARDYQRNDILRMLDLKNVFNRNKPGYGKTFEAIEYCRILGLKKILVICPKSVVPQWKKQFAQWWPEVDQDVQMGGLGPEGGERVIYVTNYEQLTPRCIGHEGRRKVLKPSQVWQRCKMWRWDLIVLDESHRIKNASAQISVAVKDLPAEHRMCLSGTPILNHPDDLWSQLQFLDPRWSGNNYWAFVQRFCEIEKSHFGQKPIGLTPSDSARDLLGKVLASISVGGDNQSVTEGKNYIKIDIPMTTEQKKLYRAIVDLALDSLEEQGITVKNAMDQIVKQQQVTTNCCKFINENNGKVVCPTNPKFEWIKDWLEDNEGEPLVVFTKFAEAAKALSEWLTKNKIQNALFIGEMSGKERLKAKEQFVQHSAACRVLIGTIGAMGTGVDELQYVCSNVVFLDRDWTPGINEQAEDRVNRSGAKNGMTNIWILNAEKSIDEHVENIQGKKAEDIEEVFKRVSNSVRSW